MRSKKKSIKGYNCIDCLYCALLFNANAKPVKVSDKLKTLYRRADYEHSQRRGG